MAIKRATMWASGWLATRIDAGRRRTRRALVLATFAALGLGAAPLARAGEGKAPASPAASEADPGGESAPPARDDPAPSAKAKSPVPLIVPSEEVSADAAISFPADI